MHTDSIIVDSPFSPFSLYLDAEGEVVLEEDWKFLVQFQPEAKDCALVNLTLNVSVLCACTYVRTYICMYVCLYVRTYGICMHAGNGSV